ncbi:MAG: hypothetical protein P0107_00875 [Nitrosomonas sp.]|nr:hypothetical protein [Nitrosomonas sp.]
MAEENPDLPFSMIRDILLADQEELPSANISSADASACYPFIRACCGAASPTEV